jgi:hypothetical protein
MQPNGWQNYPVSIESNVTVSAKIFKKTTMYFNVSGQSGQTGYINATMPAGLNATAIRVFIDMRPVQPPFPIIAANGTHYFIYFEFTLSTHQIAIKWLYGDINDDGIVNIKDATQIGLYWMQTVSPAPANVDINGDGIVNIKDATIVGINWLQHA